MNKKTFDAKNSKKKLGKKSGEKFIESIIEVHSGRANWIVRRGSTPQGWNPKQYAMLIAENLSNNKREHITLCFYDFIHSHADGQPIYHYIQYTHTIAVPQCVKDAVEKLALTLSNARREEDAAKHPKKPAQPNYDYDY